MLVYGVVIPCLPMLVIDRLKGNSAMVGFLFGCYGMLKKKEKSLNSFIDNCECSLWFTYRNSRVCNLIRSLSK